MTAMMDKWESVSENARVISEFLSWLQYHKYFICNLYSNPDHWLPTMDTHAKLIDQYLGIDANQLERERRELLDSIRRKNN